MFCLDHRKDFEAILVATNPFALVRFGDGEAAILKGAPHAAANDEWTSLGGHHWLQDPLRQALIRNVPGFCVGVPPSCCLRGCADLLKEVTAPRNQVTFATLFLHGNLRRVRELLLRDMVLVGPGRTIGVPSRGVEAAFDLDPIVEAMLQTDRPMAVSAGPLANVLIDMYWQRQEPSRRQIALDVGSALDFALSGRPTRQYHQGAVLSHHCSLSAQPLVSGRAPKFTGLRVGNSTRSANLRTARAASPSSTSPRTASSARSRNPMPIERVRSSVTVVGRSQNSNAQAAASPSASQVVRAGPQAGAGQTRRCKKCVRVVRTRK